MRILAIETATDVCSVAVSDGAHVSYVRTLEVKRAHGERLAPLIAEAMDQLGSDARQRRRRSLDCVAVSAGPGSYTGLRIGVSSAKGVALALGIPLVGVPTLQALVAAAPDAQGHAVGLLHAREREWYAATFTVAASGVIESRPAEIVSLADVQRLAVRDETTLVSDAQGATKLAAAGCDAIASRPDAIAVARVGAGIFTDGGTVDIESFEPAYLRDFVPVSRERSIFDGLPF